MVDSKPTSVSNSDGLRPHRTTGIYGVDKKKDLLSSSKRVLHTKIEALRCNCLHPHLIHKVHFVHFTFLPEVLWGVDPATQSEIYSCCQCLISSVMGNARGTEHY